MRFAIRPLSANLAPTLTGECPENSGCAETQLPEQPPCETSQEVPAPEPEPEPEPQPEYSGCQDATLRECDAKTSANASAAKRAIRAQMMRAARASARTAGPSGRR